MRALVGTSWTCCPVMRRIPRLLLRFLQLPLLLLLFLLLLLQLGPLPELSARNFDAECGGKGGLCAIALLAGAADIARVKALTSEHPLARRLLARLVAEESSLAMVSDGRSTASTIVDCALLWRLSGNASWAAKGLAVVEAEANARTEWPSSASEYLDWGDLMHGLAIG